MNTFKMYIAISLILGLSSFAAKQITVEDELQESQNILGMEADKPKDQKKNVITEAQLKAIIPKFKVNGTMEAVCAELEKLLIKIDPNKVGVKITYDASPSGKKHHFDFTNMPLNQILPLMSRSSGLNFEIRKTEIVISD